MSTVCIFFNISVKPNKHQDFFVSNALNSFKKWNPDVEVLLIENDNLHMYMEKDYDYKNNIGILRVHVIDFVFRNQMYSKVIMLGTDTYTCARLDEFIEDTDSDIICSLGARGWKVKTQYWECPIVKYEHNGKTYQDNTFINADVTCINSIKGASLVFKSTVDYFTNQSDQGGLNYCYINKETLGLKVRIVDFPYDMSPIVYNIRSKGLADGGYQMRRGKLYWGFDGPCIGDVYPTSEYTVNDDKLFTKDGQHIKVFHIAESISSRKESDDLTLDEQVDEIKKLWFNKETIKFLEVHCNCTGFD